MRGKDPRDQVAARRGYLRATRYLQLAIFIFKKRPLGYNKHILPPIEQSIRDFRKDVQVLDDPVHFLEIDYEDSMKLPGYLYLSSVNKNLPSGKTPILIDTGDGDTTQEKIYFINTSVGPNLDLDHVAITGASIHGYYALRRAVDPRIKA